MQEETFNRYNEPRKAKFPLKEVILISSVQEKKGAEVLSGNPAFGSSLLHFCSGCSLITAVHIHPLEVMDVTQLLLAEYPHDSLLHKTETLHFLQRDHWTIQNKGPRPFHHVMHPEWQVNPLVSSRQWGKRSLPSPEWNGWEEHLDCTFSNDFSWLLIGCYCW